MRPQKISASLRTEERILKNALQHFCDYGYHGTSVREITAASEVTKPTLYYYYKNKEELFVKLAEACFDEAIQIINDVSSRDLRFKDAINSFFKVMSDTYDRNPTLVRFIYSVVVAPQKGTPDVGTNRFREVVSSAIEGMVERGVKNGEIRKDKKTCVRVISAGLLSLHSRTVVRGRDELAEKWDFDEVIDQILESAKP